MLKRLIKIIFKTLKKAIKNNFWLKRFFFLFYNKFWIFELKLSWLFFKFNNNNLADKIYVNPSRIKYELKLNKFNYKFYTNNAKPLNSTKNLKHAKIIRGKWDLSINLTPFENSLIYISFYNHFIKKYRWEETEYYNFKIKKNFLGEDSKIKNKLEDELIFFDTIYDDIKKKENVDKGYLSETNDFFSNNNKFINLKKEDYEIIVAIGRFGEIILFRGHQILSISKLLNLENIPVKVLIRHSKWVKFRNEILSNLLFHGLIYQPLIHPDLSFIKTSYDDNRFLAIRDNIKVNEGTLLDIGANFGYFCHKFEDLGFDCYAVEMLPRNIYFMKKLRNIEKKKFKIINKSIFELREKNDFDVILALNVFHHFLKDKNSYENLKNLLNRLKMKELYFQTNNPEEFKNTKTYKIMGPEEFVQFIIDNSCLKEKKLIYIERGSKKRKLFKLSA